MRSANGSRRRILIDTDVLVAFVNEQNPEHEAVRAQLLALQAAGHELIIAPQCLYEFWVVATRPAENNGLGKPPSEANELLEQVREAFSLYEDPPGIVDEWQRLCVAYQIVGKRAHDARLVAYMRGHGIDELLTLNREDFRRFDGNEIRLL
jgi:predicted nucleic acid-binding protein